MYAGESNLFLEGKAAWEAPLISGCKGSGESEEKSHTDPPSSPPHHSAPHLPSLGSAGLLPPAGTNISQAVCPKGTQDSPSSKEQKDPCSLQGEKAKLGNRCTPLGASVRLPCRSGGPGSQREGCPAAGCLPPSLLHTQL